MNDVNHGTTTSNDHHTHTQHGTTTTKPTKRNPLLERENPYMVLTLNPTAVLRHDTRHKTGAR